MATKMNEKLARTTIDIPEERRVGLCELLNARLADLIDLGLMAKQAHWNVKGPHFIGLHKLFDEIHDAVEGYVDLTAERCAQLGGTAYGTSQAVVETTSLSEYPREISTGKDHVEAMTRRLFEAGKAVRQAITTAEDEFEDKDTADVLTGISRGLDQWRWFVEAHIQADE